MNRAPEIERRKIENSEPPGTAVHGPTSKSLGGTNYFEGGFRSSPFFRLFALPMTCHPRNIGAEGCRGWDSSEDLEAARISRACVGHGTLSIVTRLPV